MPVTIDGTNGVTTPSPVVVQGSTSGSITLAAPAVAGSNTQTLVATTGTLAPIVSGTAVASTSGTAIDFTGIPSWAKRITVMFNGVSTNGSSNIQIQIGSGSVTTTGYVCTGALYGGTNTTTGTGSTTGFLIGGGSASGAIGGLCTICLLTSNIWIASSNVTLQSGNYLYASGGNIALSGALDRIRITTVNGTDTFDAGSINILYE